MKFIITAHPIDRKLQEQLGIYQSNEVASDSVGRVLEALVNEGYDKIHSYVEKGTMYIHCKDKE